MKKYVLLVVVSFFITVDFASAQTVRRTITNLDLDKYKQTRIAADKDLRENYEALGFPSPEELEKQRKADNAERERVSENLRRDRLDRERLQIERQYLQTQTAPDVYVVQNSTYQRSYPYVYGFGQYKFKPQYYYPSGTFGGGFFYPNSNPNQGVQINTTPIQINTTGPNNPPVRIKAPK